MEPPAEPPPTERAESALEPEVPPPSSGVEQVRALKARVDQEKLVNAQAALETATEALTLAQTLAQPEALAWAQWAMGNALAHLNRYREALANFQAAAGSFPAGSLEQVGLFVNQLAMLQELGNFGEAIDLAEKTRLLCERLGPPARASWAALEMNLGSALEQQGQLEQALMVYARGKSLAEPLGATVFGARMDVNCANVLKQLDRFDDADALLIQARHALLSEGQHQEVARVELNRGRLAHRRGHYQHALVLLEQARAGFDAIPNPREVAVVDLHRAMVYLKLNLLEEATHLSRGAGTQLEKEGMRWLWAQAETVAGQALWRLGRLEDADQHLQKARELLEAHAPNRARELELERAWLALDARQLESAQALGESVLASLSPDAAPSLKVRCLGVVGLAALERTPPALERAVHASAEARAILETHSLPTLAAMVAQLQARVETHYGNSAGAIQALHAAVAHVEHLSALLTLDELRLGFLDDKQALYDALVQHQSQKEDLPALLQTLSRRLQPPEVAGEEVEPEARALPDAQRLAALRDAWHWHQTAHLDAGGEPSTAVPTDRTQRLKGLEAELGELVRRRQLWLEGSSPAPESPSPWMQASPELWQVQLQQRLEPNALLLQYFWEGDRLRALGLTRDAVWLSPGLGQASFFARWLQVWRFQVAQAPITGRAAGLNAHLRHLYRSVVAPIQTRLEPVARIWLILPPDLHELPLQAAWDGQQFLLERHEVLHLAAPQELPELETGFDRGSSDPLSAASMPSTGHALVMGYSDGNRLPFTGQEAEAIALALGLHHPVHLRTEQAATIAAFQQQSRDAALIHLAAHALFRLDNPAFSWIQLADGRLTVGELAQLQFLKRPVVTLSACETGRSLPRGGGLLGMGRALLAAGAKGVLLSRWQVQDDATSHLMTGLYARLTSLQASGVAQALRAAQCEAIAAQVPVHHWAAFLFLHGNAGD